MNPSPAKLKPFNFFDINNLYDELSGNSALNALGALLAESNFDMLFSGSNPESEENRYGLKHIIDMYLDFQSKAVSRLCDKAKNSPEWIIFDARKVLKEIRQNSCCANDNRDSISAVLSEIEAVINAFPSEYPEALSIKHDLTALLQDLAQTRELRRPE